MRKGLWIVCFLVWVSSGLCAGWLRFYGGTAREYGASIQSLEDGSLIIAGGSGSLGGAWLVKLDSCGDSLWNKVWEGGGAWVTPTSDRGFILSGDITPPGEWKQVLLIKTDSLGSQQWQNTFGGDNQDRGNCVVEVEDGYVICGYKSFLTLPGPELYVIKTDLEGNAVWEKTYVQDSFSSANCMDRTVDGGFIVTGYSGWFGDTTADQNLWLLKLDGGGDTVWTRTYGLTDCYDHGESVRQTADGGYVICGWTESYGDPYGDLWIIKTDQYGDSLWSRVYGGPWADAGAWIEPLSNGYIVTGLCGHSGSDGDLWLLRTDTLGDTLWSRCFGGQDWERGYSVTQCPDGGFCATGITRSFGSGNFDMLVVKVDSLGNLPSAVAPTSIVVPAPDSNVGQMVPRALYTDLSHQSYPHGFYAYCTIAPVDSADDPTPLYLDSVWVGDTLQPWKSTEVQFDTWSSPIGSYEVSFHACGQDFTSPVLSTTFYWSGIDEEPVSASPVQWFMTQSMGREIVIDCSRVSGSSQILVYDACGRRIDHISISPRSNRVSWGADASPGIYFLLQAGQSSSGAQKIVILK